MKYRGYVQINIPKEKYSQMKKEKKSFEDIDLLERINLNDLSIDYSMVIYENKNNEYTSKTKIIKNIKAKSIYMAEIVFASMENDIVEVEVKKEKLLEFDEKGNQKFYFETKCVLNVSKAQKRLVKIRESIYEGN